MPSSDSHTSSAEQGRLFGDCPCGSGKTYGDCCRLYHTGKAIPTTAEVLMRSRYSAYFFRLADYLYATTHPDNRSLEMKAELERTIDDYLWRKLSIISVSKGTAEDKKGKVEFIAQFHHNGNFDELHEHSRFRKVRGSWKYLDAKV